MDIKNYTLTLDIDFEKKKYTGNEQIIIGNPGKLIELDIDEISVTSVRINDNDVDYKAEKNTLRIANTCERDIRLNIEFSTTVSDSLHGFYMAGTKENYILSTQFEPNGARRAFPCVDNPAFKSTFDLTLIIDEELSAISNMPIKKNTVLNGKRRVEFDRTPRMPSYILYIGIGHFEEISDAFRDKKIYMAAMKGRLVRSSYPIDSAKKSLAYLEKYTNIKYMLPKLHLISVPEFGAGAMENWGAITFREVLLNIDSSTSNKAYKRSSEVITHELVHHWFGDLVTMKWWNDLWLNESFATFMGTKMQDRVFPEHEAFSTLLVGRTAGALVLDGMESTHPIRVEVKSPLEIRQVFDGISYGKGASVLRMVEAYLGEAAFRQGVHEYLREFAFGNSRGSDLWRHLAEASQQPVDRILDTWTGVPGYPILVARRSGTTVRIAQQPFRYLGTPPPQLWPVPLTYRIGTTEGRRLMEGAETTLEAPPGVPVLLNAGRHGFYRVEYDAEGYEALGRAWPDLAPVDRWGLLDDLYALLQAGRVDFAQYRRWVERALDTSDHILVVQLEGQLTALARLVQYAGPVAALQQEFLARQRRRLGLDPKAGEPENHAAEREPLLIESAVSHPETARALAARFARYADQDPSIRTGVLIGRVREGGGDGFAELRSALLKETRDEEGVRLVTALAYTRSGDQLQELLELTLSGQVSRIYLVQALITSSGSPEGVGPSWTFFQSHLDEIRRVVQGTPFVSSLPEFCLPRWGLKDPKALREFLAAHPLPEMDRGIRKGLERLQILEGLRARLPKA